MSRRPRKQPCSMQQAYEMCLEHARTKHNRSIDQIADLMGLPNKWSLYKWVANCRMPMNLILAFEHACGASYITEYLAFSGNRLLVDLPRGVKPSEGDINDLQLNFSHAVALLIACYDGHADVEETLGAINTALRGLVWHDQNVRKQHAPELDMFEDDES